MKNVLAFVSFLLIALSSYSQSLPEIKLIIFDGDTLNNIPIRNFTNAIIKFDSLEGMKSENKILIDRLVNRDNHIKHKDSIIDELFLLREKDMGIIDNYENLAEEDSKIIFQQKKSIRRLNRLKWVAPIVGFIVGVSL